MPEFSPAGGAAAVLAVVFVVAAGAKARHRTATASEFTELGLLAPDLLARVVPAAELVIAIALLVARPVGGVAAFALLAAFTTVLYNVTRSGRVVSCRCFGAMSSRPVSTLTLVRNGVLLALAAIAALF